METEKKETVKRPNRHQGHAIKRLRIDKGLSQKQLGELVHIVQQRISFYEEQEEIDDEMLERFAQALGVTTDLIKELEDDKPFAYYIQNNTITNENNTTESGTITGQIGENHSSTINPDKALYTALEQMQKLYESSMQLCNQYFKTLEARVEALEKDKK